MRFGLCVLSALLCLPLILADGEEKYDLGLKFQKGEKIYYTAVQRGTEKSAFMQGEQKSSSEMVIELNVDDVGEDGTSTISFKFLRLRLETDRGRFDSEKKEESTLPDMEKKICEAYLKHTLRAKVTPKGRVKDIEGLEKLMGEIEDAIVERSKQMPENARKMMEDMIKKSVKNSLKNSINWFPYLPKDKVGVGDSWEFTEEKMMALFSWKATFKELTEKEGKKIAIIEMELKEITLNAEDNPFAAMIEIVNSKGEGRVELNITDGRVVSMKQKISFEQKSKMMDKVISSRSTEGSLKLLKEPPKEEKGEESK